MEFGQKPKMTASAAAHLPWQRPGAVGFIYGRQPLFQVLAPSNFQPMRLPPNVVYRHSVGTSHVSTSAAAMPSAKRLRTASDPDRKRMLALYEWMAVVMRLPHAAVYSQLEKLAPGARLASLTHTLMEKSTSTLETRLVAVRLFERWCIAGRFAWPPEEETLYSYILDCRFSKSATRASSLLSALNFVGGTFGLPSLLQTVASKRVHGAASEQLMAIPLRRQARMFSFAGFARFEDIVCVIHSGQLMRGWLQEPPES